MVVVFSTYQSIDVISKAQKNNFPDFDIIICDEAHRTTGVTLANKSESHFVKVHDQKFIKSKKRLYMTATPRIFADKVKTKANSAGAVLCSMDNEDLYGPEFHRLGFGKAVNAELLTDYKVLVLAVDENIINPKFQKQFADDDGEIPLADIAKIIGCWNGLSKRFVGEEALAEDGHPMKRAVAFASTIKNSKSIASAFQNVVAEYISKNPTKKDVLNCELEHVDGTFNALLRNQKLDWLKMEPPENTCRILTNARCLSEGVDVPSLDAVLFLNPRKSMVDVVQSVGRIMRRSEGKKYGYVILPIGIPAGMSPEEALKDNKKYEVVWQVLQALRAHDDRFDAQINKIELNKMKSSVIKIIGVASKSDSESSDNEDGVSDVSEQILFDMPEIEGWKDAIYAKIVIKCGSRPYWENWALEVAKIAEKHTVRIKSLIELDNSKPRKAFQKFLNGIKKNINPAITESDAIEMLSQHLITKPIFDALFEHYAFASKNPVSRSMQEVLDILETDVINEDAEKLKSFYNSVRMRISGINNPEGRQKIIVELYDRFFKIAFPKMSERLGIVYTPIEVVDFIINSVESVLNKEFNQSLTDQNVHILDPFTGTGTFIVRLLQSGVIKKEDLMRKFKTELHANEIVLLAYYIAAINIEETYNGIMNGEYIPFEGIVLADTFQLTESEQGILDTSLTENSKRVEKQKESTIQVIISNPPYSAGQKDANDNNQNLDYPSLDERIKSTYVQESSATLKNSLYDSYIRGIRWATDRVGNNGVIGFVTNGSFIDGNAADGLRKSFSKEYSKIYCFNLRGNARTQGEDRRKEKGNVFDIGTRTPVAITIMIKKVNQSDNCDIYYHDIGDYLTREQKLQKISDFKSIENINWVKINPNVEGDWINFRNPEFDNFVNIGNKEDPKECIFNIHSRGVMTSKDAWLYNSSVFQLTNNIENMISFYNFESERYADVTKNKTLSEYPNPEEFFDNDQKKISWDSELKIRCTKGEKLLFFKDEVVINYYRPFFKNFYYFNKDLNLRLGLMPQFFPTPEHKNLVFGVTGSGSSKPFSTLITKEIPDLEFISKSQCFPLYYYEKVDDGLNNDLLKIENAVIINGYIRRDSITDIMLMRFIKAQSDNKISKADVFYYVYGLLHSAVYRNKFQNDLKKMLPRIPTVKDFWGFSKSGRELADWHLNYETIAPFDLIEEINPNSPKDIKVLYSVDKTGMRFPKIGRQVDRSTIILNSYVILKGIPLEAYDYIVNGKSAIEWVMERYKVTVDLNSKGQGSGIKNDPNDWSEDPRYIIDLVKRVVRVSLETNRIVNSLPDLEIIETDL